MKRSIGVFMANFSGGDRLIGTLRHEIHGNREYASFEYDEGWLAGPAFQIDPALRLVKGPQQPTGGAKGSLIFHSIIADTEPDGWGKAVIKRDHAKRRQAAKEAGERFDDRPLNNLDYLLTVDDFARLGALRFQREDGTFMRPPEDGRRTTPPLMEIDALLRAARAVEADTETAADLRYLIQRGSPLGGMRPKCTIMDEDGVLAIGKFPSAGDGFAVTKGEVLALSLAGRAGIRAAQARLIQSLDLPVAIIRRFDRTANGGRILFASAATMLGVDTALAGDNAYTDIVDAIRQYGGTSVVADIEELWRRVAFSILINNVDDHLHNHGFLHEGHGHWRLSPVYDINPFPDRAPELKLWISSDTGPDAKIETLLSVAQHFGLKGKRPSEILQEVEIAVSTWRTLGQEIGMTKAELDEFDSAFENPQRKIARREAGL